MTTLIQDILALLAPIAAGGAWYAVNSAEPPTYPFIVWQRVVSTTNNNLSGASDLQNTRIQVDVFSRQISEANTLAASVVSAMAASSIKNVQLSSQDFYEDAVKAYRVSIDFSVWATN